MSSIRRPTGILVAAIVVSALLAGAVQAGEGVTAKTTGSGVSLLLGTLPATFGFNAQQRADGAAKGHLSYSVVFQGELVEFEGRVTCVTDDPVNHRAWVGGVITANRSTHPTYTMPRTQVGRDIWFRVVDYGEGSGAPPDRMTFVGFEGDAGFATSAAYCAGQPWRPDDASTWAVSEGNIQVHD